MPARRAPSTRERDSVLVGLKSGDADLRVVVLRGVVGARDHAAVSVGSGTDKVDWLGAAVQP